MPIICLPFTRTRLAQPKSGGQTPDFVPFSPHFTASGIKSPNARAQRGLVVPSPADKTEASSIPFHSGGITCLIPWMKGPKIHDGGKSIVNKHMVKPRKDPVHRWEFKNHKVDIKHKESIMAKGTSIFNVSCGRRVHAYAHAHARGAHAPRIPPPRPPPWVRGWLARQRPM